MANGVTMRAILAVALWVVSAGAWQADAANDVCDPWTAKLVSSQGRVDIRRSDGSDWTPARLDDILCPGDMVRTDDNSRAALLLFNQAILRLDQQSTITVSGADTEESFLIRFIKGIVYFFSRFPKRLKVETPFANAVIDGTEFTVAVAEGSTLITLLEGRLLATNANGELILAPGEAAIASPGAPPTPHPVARPRDGVRWALYYPPVVYWRSADFAGGPSDGWEEAMGRSIDFYWKGDLANAVAAVAGVTEPVPDSRFYLYRAALALTVGQIDAASGNLSRVLAMDPGNADALAIQSIMATVRNDKPEAVALAQKAVDSDATSSPARVAMSYALQSRFDLEGALEQLQLAGDLDPENGLVWSRLSEVHLSLGDSRKAMSAARKAVDLNPDLSRTQSVLGFAALARTDISEAMERFEMAIGLDSSAPLPRLGLGLARIRSGDLDGGRSDIEIAVSLDPDNSLIRSYLGKAYFDEKRNDRSAAQLEIAKALDPNDPTPHFYDAIRKQTINRPVEALKDLQKSIALNDNRAVYRSKLLLDEDLAARSASLGSIYRDLGFEQSALIEGWKSVNFNPANYSAHRFLADTYSTLPRHEIARVSELLQSQLLQPLNMTPVQPQLAESSLFIQEGAGPSVLSFNEFNPLFARNRFALQANGVAGGKDTYGNDLVQSAIWNRLSYSIGQYHYETDGFRDNNDLDQDIYNAFVQTSLSPEVNLQAEYRYRDIDRGDPILLFDPNAFLKDFKEEEDSNFVRFGLRYSPMPGSDILVSLSHNDVDFEQTIKNKQFGETEVLDIDEDGYGSEVQYLFRNPWLNAVGGGGYFRRDSEETDKFDDGDSTTKTRSDSDTNHYNFYFYSYLTFPHNVTWTIGASVDLFDSDDLDLNENQFNPKFGVSWQILPKTALRAAAFRTFKRTLLFDQTLEPTQVSGFNQFYDDGEGTEAWRYGVGLDQQLTDTITMGAEYTKRDLDVVGEVVEDNAGGPPDISVKRRDWDEKQGRVYLYWAPHPWIALSAEYDYEEFERTRDFQGDGNLLRLTTQRFSAGIGLFHPSGLSLKVQPIYMDQDGKFGLVDGSGSTEEDNDRFAILNAAISYRLPKRFGILSIEARNLFDNRFDFQDTDPANPSISPERLILVKLVLSF